MLDSVGKWLVYLALVAGVLFVGWSQPLRYRFMSTQEIYLLEHPQLPPVVEPRAVPVAVTPKPTPWMWDPNRRTKLDR